MLIQAILTMYMISFVKLEGCKDIGHANVAADLSKLEGYNGVDAEW